MTPESGVFILPWGKTAVNRPDELGVWRNEVYPAMKMKIMVQVRVLGFIKVQ